MPRPAASPLSQRTPTRLPGAAAALRRRIGAWRIGTEASALQTGATVVLGAGATAVMLALGPLTGIA